MNGRRDETYQSSETRSDRRTRRGPGPATLVAQTSYRIETLGGLGGTIAGANSINNRGWASGTANEEGDIVSHAALWVGESAPIDLGSFGGPDGNSAVAWPIKNNNGLIVAGRGRGLLNRS